MDSPSPQRSPDEKAVEPLQVGNTLYVPKVIHNRTCLVAESQPDNLEFTFVVKFDSNSGRPFYVNVQTRSRVWELPDISSIGQMHPLPTTIQRGTTTYALCRSTDGENVFAPRDLPEGLTLQPAHCWLPRADRVNLRYFFINVHSNERVNFLPPVLELLERIEIMFRHYDITDHEGDYLRAAAEWAGKEAQLLADYVIRYGPEPMYPSLARSIVEAYILKYDDDKEIPVESRIEDLLAMHQGDWEAVLEEMRKAFGPPPRTIRQRVLALFQQYNTSKLHNVDDLLAQFEGKGEELIEQLVAKLGPESDDGAWSKEDLLVKRVEVMLHKYDPVNEHRAAEFVGNNKGQELQLMEALVKRYGPEPQVLSDSTRSVLSSPLASPRSVSTASTVPAATDDHPYRARLMAFYKRYNPGKLNSVDETLRKYSGQEDFLMDQLVRKYGPEPLLSPRGPADASSSEGTSGSNSPREPAGPVKGTADQTVVCVPPLALANEGTVRSTRERIEAMYTYYAPDQVQSIGMVLHDYGNNELDMLKALVDAHGPEPTRDQLAACSGRQRQVQVLEHTAATEATVSTPTSRRKRGQSLMDQWRGKVSAILMKHEPALMLMLDQLLREYSGREDELIRELEEKYSDRQSTATDKEQAEQATVATPAGVTEEPASATEIGPKETLKSSNLATSTETTSPAQADESLPQAPSIHSPPVPGATSTADPCVVAIDQAEKSAQVNSLPTSITVEVSPSLSLSNESAFGQLVGIEKRLQEAFDNSERAMRRNEALHEENMKLTRAHHELKRQCDLEIRGMEAHLNAFKDRLNKMKHEYAVERIQLKAQEEAAVMKVRQETQEERARFSEVHLQNTMERKRLEAMILEHQATMATCESNIRGLEAKIKRKEAELQESRAEIKFLTIQLDRENMRESGTQTEPMNHQGGVPSFVSGRSVESCSNSASETFRLNNMPSATLDYDVQLWKEKFEALHRELELAKAEKNQVLTECENANKFIHVLKMKKRRLEEVVSRLELRELALPDGIPADQEAEKHRLAEEVVFLQKQLQAADAENKNYKREITELRSLLALHMSGGTRIKPLTRK